jgi:hypothetical protein
MKDINLKQRKEKSIRVFNDFNFKEVLALTIFAIIIFSIMNQN